MSKLFGEDDNLPEPEKYYEELVGENKKFKDPEALAKGKWHADKALEMKERQFDELSKDYLKLKADYDARAKLEEYFDQKLSDKEAQLPKDANNQPAKSVDPDEIDKLLDAKLSSYERQKKLEQNLNKSMDVAKEKLGSSWKTNLKTKMEELDLSEDETYEMMQLKPKLFVTTFGLDDRKPSNPFQAPPTSSQRSDIFKPKVQGEEHTWSYFQKLKEKDPRAWLDPKVQTQMYQASQRLGAAFADGDFNQYSERL